MPFLRLRASTRATQVASASMPPATHAVMNSSSAGARISSICPIRSRLLSAMSLLHVVGVGDDRLVLEIEPFGSLLGLIVVEVVLHLFPGRLLDHDEDLGHPAPEVGLEVVGSHRVGGEGVAVEQLVQLG